MRLPDAKESGEDSEAAQTLAFRHSPTVAWIAKTTGMDIETTAKLLEYINFAVIVLAIAIPLFKILPKAMRQRSAKLSVERRGGAGQDHGRERAPEGG